MIIKNFRNVKNRFFTPVLSITILFILSCSGSQAVRQNVPRWDEIPQEYSPDSPDFASLLGFQQEVLGKLTGEFEIQPGLKIPDRFLTENRVAARTFLLEVFSRMGMEGERHFYEQEIRALNRPGMEDIRANYENSGENIFADLKATSSTDEYIIIGAHYDSVRECPGANDDATGVTMVMALANYFSQMKYRSKNILFVLFDQEEMGLVGSRHFTQKLIDEKFNVHSVHTIDQMGWDSDGDGAIELEVPYEGVLDIYESASREYGFDVTVFTTEVTSSDHSSFRRQGFKAVGVTEEYRHDDTTPYYHKPTDTYKTINFPYLASSTLLVFRTLEKIISN